MPLLVSKSIQDFFSLARSATVAHLFACNRNLKILMLLPVKLVSLKTPKSVVKEGLRILINDPSPAQKLGCLLAYLLMSTPYWRRLIGGAAKKIAPQTHIATRPTAATPGNLARDLVADDYSELKCLISDSRPRRGPGYDVGGSPLSTSRNRCVGKTETLGHPLVYIPAQELSPARGS